MTEREPADLRTRLLELHARVVYERNDAYDMQSGPHGYERVGFVIGDRVFWTGCAGSHMPPSTYESDKALAETIVARWNAAALPSPPADLKSDDLLLAVEEFVGWWGLHRDGSVNAAYARIDTFVKDVQKSMPLPAPPLPDAPKETV